MSRESDAVDTAGIRNLVARAADSVCRRDEERWAGTWAEDGVWKLMGQSIHGRDNIRERWVLGMAKYPFVALLVFNSEVEVDGDTGSGRWWIQEINRNEADETSLMVGVYCDRYARTHEGWRFAERSYQRTYLGPVAPGEMILPDPLPGAVHV